MADIIIKMPGKGDDKITTGATNQLGYQEFIDGKPNPEKRLDFLIRNIEQFIKNLYTAFQANKAAEDARTAAIIAADSDLKSVTP